MPKITITPISSTISNTAANTINNNFNAIADALENTVSRDGTTPNQMESDLDLNGNDLINVGLVDAHNIQIDDQNLQEILDQAATSAEQAEMFAEQAEDAAQEAINTVASVQAELLLKEDKDQKGIAGGYAPIGLDGKIPSSLIPEGGSYLGIWDASTNTPTITAGVGINGDFYSVSIAGTQSISGSPENYFVGDTVRFNGNINTWERIPDNASVIDVAGKTGNVVLVKGDVGLGNVDNTSDVNKPVSTAQQTALNGKVGQMTAPLDPVTGDRTAGYTGTGSIGTTSNTTGSTGFPSNIGFTWSYKANTVGRDFDLHHPQSASSWYLRTYDNGTGLPQSWLRILLSSDIGSTVAPLVGGLIPRQYIPSSVVTPEQFDANAGTGGNDNVALQAALDAGGIVLLTRPYITTTTLNVTQNGTTIIGYGGSISHNTSSLIDVMLIRQRSNCNVFGLEINGRRDLKSASGQSNTRGITMYSCTNVNIKDCYIHDTLEHGIRTGNDGDTPVIISRHINIENNRVENCGNTTPRRGYGIWLFSENHDCKVVGNKVRNCVAGGIAADDVSDTKTTGLENERVIIGYNNVYNSAFDPNPGNSIGIWVGGSQNITVVGNNVRGYRNGIMLEDSQANSLNAWVTVTGNNVEAGPVGIMIRNSAFSVISGNTIKANKPPSGSFSGEATGILIYGYSEVAGPRRTHDILVQGNLIYTERRGISFVNPSYHTPVSGGVNGVTISGNHLIHFNTVNTNDNAIEINDGGVSNYVQDIVVEGNVADGFSIGYRYNASITNHGIFQRNTAQNCTVAGFNVTGNNQMLIGNTTRDNAVGILFSSANSATVVVKDHTFQSDSANTSGSNGSVTKINNYPSI